MGLWVVAGWMALVGLSSLGFIAWGLRSHQFDDVEAPKYDMLEDREPIGWPDRRAPHRGESHA
jgi:cbb3-type cytochrome oxidase maturation protein